LAQFSLNQFKMAKLIIDTNFLMIPVQFKVDIFEEFRRIMETPFTLYIIDKTIDEISKLKQKSKTKSAASVALLSIRKYNLRIIPTSDPEKDVDSLILEKAKKCDFVATQDIALRVRLKKAGVHIITLRKKSFLALV